MADEFYTSRRALSMAERAIRSVGYEPDETIAAYWLAQAISSTDTRSGLSFKAIQPFAKISDEYRWLSRSGLKWFGWLTCLRFGKIPLYGGKLHPLFFKKDEIHALLADAQAIRPAWWSVGGNEMFSALRRFEYFDAFSVDITKWGQYDPA